MVKSFVLDTNVLLHDSNSMYNFADNKVIIPIAVIEELDHFKSNLDEKGRNARHITRQLDNLRKKGKLNEGIPLDNGGSLKIELDRTVEIPANMNLNQVDNRIIMISLHLKKKGETVILISKDINLRIKAEVLGLEVQDFEKSKVNVEELYSGMRTLEVDGALIDKFYKENKIVMPEVSFNPNEFIVLEEKGNASKSALAKYNVQTKELLPLKHKDTVAWGIKPVNKEQRFAMELLLDPNINLVTLLGVAGTGKTLLSISCGLQMAIDEELYRRLIVCRPIIPIGRDIGYLPGTKEEKLQQWMGAINDNLEFLIDRKHQQDAESVNDKIKYLYDCGKVEVEALTYIRGRTLPQQYMIVDDAQNLTPHEVKSVISRAGEGTKVVMTGDPYQIDNPYLDPSSNGLTYAVERFKGQNIFGHITFKKSVRSKLASLAADLL